MRLLVSDTVEGSEILKPSLRLQPFASKLDVVQTIPGPLRSFVAHHFSIVRPGHSQHPNAKRPRSANGSPVSAIPSRLPCVGKGLAELMGRVTLSGLVGSILIHCRSPCQQTSRRRCCHASHVHDMFGSHQSENETPSRSIWKAIGFLGK